MLDFSLSVTCFLHWYRLYLFITNAKLSALVHFLLKMSLQDSLSKLCEI
jgi:hypothetical protein